MKKLLFLFIASFIIIGANAQVANIRIENNSGCDIYVELRGDPSTTACPAPFNNTSGILTLGANTVTNYDNITPPGTFPSGDFYYEVILYAYDPNWGNACGVGTASFTMDYCTGNMSWFNQILSDTNLGSCVCSTSSLTIDWQANTTLGLLKIY